MDLEINVLLIMRFVCEYVNRTENKFYFSIIFSTQTNLPIFRFKNSSVRRRYSDFDWLRKELERDSKVR